MRIVIVGSMSFKEKILEIKGKLEELGHEVIIPPSLRIFKKTVDEMNLDVESKKQFKKVLEYYYFKVIENSDAILIVNLEKKAYKGYIGPMTFLEIMYAFYQGKKIYALREIDVDLFKDELEMIEYKIVGDNLENFP